jgi:hypothetical protein
MGGGSIVVAGGKLVERSMNEAASLDDVAGKFMETIELAESRPKA